MKSITKKSTIFSFIIFVIILLFLSIYAGITINRGQAKQVMESSYSGKAVSLIDDVLIIQNDGESFSEVSISHNTKILLGDKIISRSELSSGSHIIIFGKKNSDSTINAELIRVFPPPKKMFR